MSEKITGTIDGVHGFTTMELRNIWGAMQNNPDGWDLLTKRLACMAVGLTNQMQPLREAVIAAADAKRGHVRQ